MAARCTLKFVEIENFKSYSGFHILGPLEKFSAIVGPNGSGIVTFTALDFVYNSATLLLGKSNFMDAVSFVMGEKPLNLRVHRLDDLIHGASTDERVSRSATVTATFELEDESLLKFTRTVANRSSVFKVNNKVCQ